jgi:hypothetical protein
VLAGAGWCWLVLAEGCRVSKLSEISPQGALQRAEAIASGAGALSLPRWACWGYLLSVAVIETVVRLTDPWNGLGLYAVLLLLLTGHSSVERNTAQRSLVLTLTLVPLARMLLLTLPLIVPTAGLRSLVSSLALLAASWIVMHQINLSPRAVGLHARAWPFQLLLLSGGLGLGALAFAVSPGARDSGPPLLVGLTELLLLLLVSLVTELLLRGLIQTAARAVIGRWALLYSALLFAIWQSVASDSFSLLGLGFALLLGLLLARIFEWSRALLGVTLLHGSTAATHTILFPLLVRLTQGAEEPLVWTTTTGALTGLLALSVLVCMVGCLLGLLLLLGYMASLSDD